MADTNRIVKLMFDICIILVFNDASIIRFIWGCLLFSACSYLFQLKQTRRLNIKDLKLSSYLITGGIILTSIISFGGLLFIYKLNNIGKQVDLKEIYFILKTFVMMNTGFMIFSTLFLVISFVMLFILLLQIIKNYIYKHFIRMVARFREMELITYSIINDISS